MTTVLETPIQTTLERVSSRFQYVNASFGDIPDGWHLASDVVRNPETVNWWLDQIFELYAMDDRRVAAAFLVLGYFWYPVIAAVGCYLLDQRLPDMRPAAIALHPTGGARFLSPHFLALPDDPAAGHPNIRVVEDRQALRSHLMHSLDHEHARPLFENLRSVAPYGIPAMRANYLDRVASTILTLTEQLGDNDLARQEVLAFMALSSPAARTGIIELTHEGRDGVFLKRAGCCLNHHLPGRAKCDTCCLIPLPDRIETLKGYLTSV